MGLLYYPGNYAGVVKKPTDHSNGLASSVDKLNSILPHFLKKVNNKIQGRQTASFFVGKIPIIVSQKDTPGKPLIRDIKKVRYDKAKAINLFGGRLIPFVKRFVISALEIITVD